MAAGQEDVSSIEDVIAKRAAPDEVILGHASRMSDDDVVEARAKELFQRFGRCVSASFAPVPEGSTQYLWTVMVEGDAGAESGMTLADALRNRLESPAPEFETGWGSEAD